MSMIAIICVLCLLTILLASFRKGSDIISPARIFSSVWIFCIGLAELKLSGFQHEWNLWAWSCLLIGLIAFLLGTWIIYTINIGKKTSGICEVRRAVRDMELISQKKYYYIVCLLFSLYIVAYSIEYVYAGGFPMFNPMPDRARSEFGIFGIHLFVSMASGLLIICHEYFLLYSKPRKYSIPILIVGITTFLTYGLQVQRFNYIMWLVIILVIIYYSSTRINFKNIFFLCSPILSFAFLLQSIRVSRYVQNYIYVVSKMKFSIRYAVFAEPYMYIVMNLENFARGVNKLENYTFGYYTSDSIMAVSGLKHPLADYYGLIERPFLNSGYNTYPFLWTYYRDFGLGGMFLCCLLLGLFISHLYYRFKMQPTPVRLMIYSISVFFIVLSFFTNILTLLTVVFNIFILTLTHSFMLKKSENKTISS